MFFTCDYYASGIGVCSVFLVFVLEHIESTVSVLVFENTLKRKSFYRSEIIIFHDYFRSDL